MESARLLKCFKGDSSFSSVQEYVRRKYAKTARKKEKFKSLEKQEGEFIMTIWGGKKTGEGKEHVRIFHTQTHTHPYIYVHTNSQIKRKKLVLVLLFCVEFFRGA